MEQLDLRLYAIVDPENTGGHDLVDLARAVAAGGATLVQLRDKVSDTAHMIAEARALKAALSPFGVPLIVNDRVDVALAAEADGVHVGQEDMAVEEARRMLGPGPSSASRSAPPSRPRRRRSRSSITSGIGGVYATTSKTSGKSPIGLDGLRKVVQRVPRAHRQFPDLRHRRHHGGERRSRDRGRRRRRLGHLGAVPSPRSAGRRPRAARRGRCGAQEIRPQGAGRRRAWARQEAGS